MLHRPFIGALFGGALFLAGGSHARAQDPASGAIVVAVASDSTAAAKPLARDVYRDDALRPSIDDATARVLVGEPLGADAPAKLKEISELRASVANPGTDAASRRLLAALGADLKAKIVVSVTIEGGRPVARVLRVESAAFEGIELGATTEPAPNGEKIVAWPGVVEALHKILPAQNAQAPTTGAAGTGAPSPAKSSGAPGPAPGAAGAPTPLGAPASKTPTKGEPSPSEGKSVWSSPWFWAILGGAVAVGAGAFAIAKATQDDGGTLRLQGRVAP